MALETDSRGMQGDKVITEKIRTINSRKKYPAMLVGIIPVIDRCVVLSHQDVVVSFDVILDHNTLNADVEKRRGGGRIFKNTLT